MNISLVCMEYDYGDPLRGRSYEDFNFYDSLRAIHKVEMLDYMQNLKTHGQSRMNAMLVEVAAAGGFDVAIFSPYTDQLDPASVEAVRTYRHTMQEHTFGHRFDSVFRQMGLRATAEPSS